MSAQGAHKDMPGTRTADSWHMMSWDKAELFSKTDVVIYTPTWNVQVILFIYILLNIACCKTS